MYARMFPLRCCCCYYFCCCCWWLWWWWRRRGNVIFRSCFYRRGPLLLPIEIFESELFLGFCLGLLLYFLANRRRICRAPLPPLPSLLTLSPVGSPFYCYIYLIIVLSGAPPLGRLILVIGFYCRFLRFWWEAKFFVVVFMYFIMQFRSLSLLFFFSFLSRRVLMIIFFLELRLRTEKFILKFDSFLFRAWTATSNKDDEFCSLRNNVGDYLGVFMGFSK